MRERGEPMIRVHRQPELNNPVLLAAWPGIAGVALTAASYLNESLGAELFAEVEPLSHFDLNGAYIERNVIQTPRLPQSRFYYWKRGEAGNDLIIFIGEAQPVSHNYEFANKILEFAQSCGVDQVYTVAAALVPNLAEKPRVWAAATDNELLKELESFGLVLRGNFYVAGMNGLLLAIAKERKMKGICLLGETPRYLGDIGNPMASKSVLEVLTRVMNVEVDMTEMENMVKQARQEIDEALRESRRQYIDHFTVPLWERPSEEEKG
jgi:uncharacterized protein (TIGR00162 family)